MPQEKFDLYFLAMGQGDCTLVKCPDDKVVMIDCGSDRGFDDDLITSGRALLRNLIGVTNLIDTVILTHHDGDHCNQLGTFLFNDPSPHVQINRIYYSNPYSYKNETLRNRCLQRYAIKDFVLKKKFGKPLINEVVINETNSFVNTWNNVLGYGKNDAIKKNIVNNRLTILSGTSTVGNKNWSISIIAASVPHESGSPSNAINSGSIVTLLEFDGHKALICGDATIDTEQFLLDNHDAAIANLKLIQVPHHGSDTSSSQAFVNKTDPNAAVISVQFLEHHHRLPKRQIMRRWTNIVTGGKPQHALDSWRSDAPAFNTLSNTMQQTIKNEEDFDEDDKTIFVGSNFWHYLDDTEGDYGVSYPNWMLNREVYTDNLWQTSMLDGTLYYTFTLPL
ncbi:MAG TPA: hypothetical protein DEF47_01970 [Herpetosiphon sp.]|uniref:Beta-lactamase domain protein n=1 Tax=Herpetosiphon aurantiacus (strain ATCC 23779 / DSM 785 / 114-95) TaxID=316274 RepID=A9AVE3_HERA2|nr:MBL fold metallo-hydrolase [Herpetosiphon sp.]ABX04634.1 beta-lactamase domain protein [Herpetosiphon aurantiacus DSM 785]HBW48653.1 hypothetical protein [Herpetosiphon sp.]